MGPKRTLELSYRPLVRWKRISATSPYSWATREFHTGDVLLRESPPHFAPKKVKNDFGENKRGVRGGSSPPECVASGARLHFDRVCHVSWILPNRQPCWVSSTPECGDSSTFAPQLLFLVYMWYVQGHSVGFGAFAFVWSRVHLRLFGCCPVWIVLIQSAWTHFLPLPQLIWGACTPGAYEDRQPHKRCVFGSEIVVAWWRQHRQLCKTLIFVSQMVVVHSSDSANHLLLSCFLGWRFQNIDFCKSNGGGAQLRWCKPFIIVMFFAMEVPKHRFL